MNIPSAVESERIVMGTLFIWPDRWPDVSSALKLEAFTDITCRDCYQIMDRKQEAGKGWSKVTIATELKAAQPKRQVIGALAELPYHCTNSEYMLGIEIEAVQEAWVLRRLQAAGVKMAEWRPGLTVGELLDPGKETIEALESFMYQDKEVTARDVLRTILDKLKAGNTGRGIPFGMPDLDEGTGGLYPGLLYVFGARPSVGKTALGITIAISAAKNGARVRFITTETTREMTTQRLCAHLGHFDAKDIRLGTVDPTKMVDAARLMPEIDIIDCDVDISDIAAGIRKWRKDNPKAPAAVIVDYLELVQAKAPTEEQRVSAIIRALHSMAKKYSVSMVVMSQLAREAEAGKGEPYMRNLRYSGAIEAAADVIGLMWSSDRNDGHLKAGHMKIDKNKLTGREYRFDYTLNKGESHVYGQTNDNGFGGA